MRSVTEFLAERTDINVVLNSWLIADMGYRRVLQLLPSELATHVMGATIPGNRDHRHRVDEKCSRAELLRSDIKRRAPDRIVIVDASRSAIPLEYSENAILVEGQHPALVQHYNVMLHALLK